MESDLVAGSYSFLFHTLMRQHSNAPA